MMTMFTKGYFERGERPDGASKQGPGPD